MINRLTLQQLRLIEAVARHRSFTRAAEELHLSQPAVSIQIKRLSASIGLPLFESVGKQLFLTRAGEEVYAAASEVVARLEGLAGTLADMRGTIGGPLQVAVVTSAKYFMPHLLGRFLAEHPAVQPQLTVTNRAWVLERLAANQDDFVIMGQVPEHLSVNAQPFMENLLVPIAHPEHVLAGERAVSLARFAKERFLMRELGSGTRAVTERLFAQHGLTVKPYMELGSSEAIKQGVVARLGVSVLSTNSLAVELETGRLRVLSVEGFPLRRMWHAVHLQGKRLSRTAVAFLEFLLHAGSGADASARVPAAGASSTRIAQPGVR